MEDALRTSLKELMDKYNRYKQERGDRGLKDLSEANVRKDFIDPLFRALGWQTDDSDEYDAENYVRGAGFVDVAARIGGKPVIFVEAKRFGGVPSRSERGVQTTLSGFRVYADWTTEERQVLNYAGMSVGVKWAILTNFEKFRLFNAKTGVTLLNIESPSEYLERFGELCLLSKINVATGNTDRIEFREELPTIDTDFLNLLNDWRLKLSRDIHAKFPTLDLEKVKHVVQRILDRLIVIRFAEDKWVLEDPDQLRSTYEIWVKTKTYQTLKLTGLLKGIFAGFDQIHDSKIFASDPDVDHVLDALDSNVLGEVILQLYNQSFRKFTADILGNTYENYLGHELVLQDGILEIRPNEQLRKSGGIYYTPSHVVDYIVQRTVGVRLEKIWKETEHLLSSGKYEEGYSEFKKVESLKIIDPACGSGSFLIRAYHLVRTYYERFNSFVTSINAKLDQRISALRKEGKNKEAWSLEGTQLKLLEGYEKEILYNNIFGMDIDPQAAEIAAVNLVLQALKKGEKLPLILDQNIRVGNSLVSPEEGNLSKFFKNPTAENPVNWSDEFPGILPKGRKPGGFDVVLGNPPHGGKLTKEERDFFGANFEIAKGYRNTASLFIERAYKILRDDGLLGFVIPKSLTFSEKWNISRDYILSKMSLLEIADISKAFPKVLLEQVVLLASREKTSSKSYLGTKLFYKESIITNEIPLTLAKEMNALPVHIGEAELGIFQKVNQRSTKMIAMSKTFRGLPIQSKVDEKKGDGKVPLVRGEDLKPFYLSEPGTFVKRKDVPDGSKVAEMTRPKLISQRIVAHILNPVDHIIIMTTLDKEGVLNVDTVENTIVTDKAYDLRYVLGWLNSKFVSWFAYNFIFNKAVRTMDFDDYYVSKIPIVKADTKSQERFAELVDRLLGQTVAYFARRPSFQTYLNQVPMTFSHPFSQYYHAIPMSLRRTGIPSMTKGSLRAVTADISDEELLINIRYEDDEGEELEAEIIRMTVVDPLFRRFLAEAISTAKFSKSKGNLLEKVLDIMIPRFKANDKENTAELIRLMTEFVRDSDRFKDSIEAIRTTVSELNGEVYKLLGFSESEIQLIENSVVGYYTPDRI
jgi:type I restriction-modification system DNA methylase subunit